MFFIVSDSGDDSCSGQGNVAYTSVDSKPGPSTALTFCEQVDQLKEIFPESSRDDLASSLTQHGTVSKAAISMSVSLSNADSESDTELMETAFPSGTDVDKVMPVSLALLLEELQSSLSSEKVKVRVDEDDVINDAMAYYKCSEFDPKKKIRVVYNNQPAADTGGVTRQFFTRLLYLLTEEFFHGDSYKSPIYNSVVVASGLMKLVGTIVVHSILQGGPGLKIFSPAVYHYLSTGDLDGAIQKMSVTDCTLRTQSLINMVSATTCFNSTVPI